MCSLKKQTLQDLFNSAVKAAHPDHCIAKYLPVMPEQGQMFVLGAGKASAAMTRAMEAHYEALGQADRLSGIAVTRHGYALPTKYIPLIEAGHPVPDKFSVQAAEKALETAKNAGENDLVLVLLSGGASALWSAPLPGITLEQKQTITRALLKSGAAIDEVNCVRKHLSRIKGGRLAAAAYPARVVTLAISDVPHDDISSIGSGPTTGDPTSLADAHEILDRYEVYVSPEIADVLAEETSESLFPEDPKLARTEYHLIATPGMAIKAAAEYAEKLGYKPVIIGDSVEGEARSVAREHAKLALEAKDRKQRTALISGGELTVTVTGSGTGGPNQEYALSLALALAGASGISAFAGDTDGVDGGEGGESDPAGAFIYPDTLSRAAEKKLDPAAFLDNNDSGSFFRLLGDLLVCGATQTNVNDFRAILIDH